MIIPDNELNSLRFWQYPYRPDAESRHGKRRGDPNWIQRLKPDKSLVIKFASKVPRTISMTPVEQEEGASRTTTFARYIASYSVSCIILVNGYSLKATFTIQLVSQ